MVNQAVILATLGLAGNTIAAPALHRAEGHARRVLTEDSSVAPVPLPHPIGGGASTLPAIQNDKRFWTQAATALASGVAGVLGTESVSGGEKREVNVEEKRFWTQAATALASGVAGVLGTNAVSGDEKRDLDIPDHEKRFWAQVGQAVLGGIGGGLAGQATSGGEEKREEMQSVWIPDEADIWVPEEQQTPEVKRFWTQAATALASGVAGVLGTEAVSGGEEKREEATQQIWIPDEADIWVPEQRKRFWAQVGQAVLGGIGGGLAGQATSGDEKREEATQSIWIPDEADIWVPEDQQTPEVKRFWTQAATALASGVAGVLGTNAVSGDEKREEATQQIWIPDEADIWVPEDQQTPEVKRFWTQAATALASGVAGVLGTEAVGGSGGEKRSLDEHEKRFWAQVGQAVLGGIGGGLAGQATSGGEEKREEATQSIWIPDEADIWVPDEQQSPQTKRFWAQVGQAVLGGIGGGLAGQATSGDEKREEATQQIWIPDEADIWVPDEQQSPETKRFWAQVGQAVLGGIGGGLAGQATSGDEKRSLDEHDKRFWAQVGQAVLGGIGGGLAGQATSGDEKRQEATQQIWIPDEADIWVPEEDTVTVNQS